MTRIRKKSKFIIIIINNREGNNSNRRGAYNECCKAGSLKDIETTAAKRKMLLWERSHCENQRSTK